MHSIHRYYCSMKWDALIDSNWVKKGDAKKKNVSIIIAYGWKSTQIIPSHWEKKAHFFPTENQFVDHLIVWDSCDKNSSWK